MGALYFGDNLDVLREEIKDDSWHWGEQTEREFSYNFAVGASAEVP